MRVCEEGLGDLRGTKYVFGVDGDALTNMMVSYLSMIKILLESFIRQ